MLQQPDLGFEVNLLSEKIQALRTATQSIISAINAKTPQDADAYAHITLDICEEFARGDFDRPQGKFVKNPEMYFSEPNQKRSSIEGAMRAILDAGLTAHLPRVLNIVLPRLRIFFFPEHLLANSEKLALATHDASERNAQIKRIVSAWASADDSERLKLREARNLASIVATGGELLPSVFNYLAYRAD